MKDILYGVKYATLEEINPDTQLPPVVGGVYVGVDTAESVEMEAIMSEGVEDIARSDSKILAVVRTPDLLYGYDVTLKDNTFDPAIASLIEGGVSTIVNDEVTGYRAPLLSEGATNLKPFRLTLYVASYEGDSIQHYVKIVMNNCSGSAFAFSSGKEFYAPEFKIRAREATKASLSIKTMSYVSHIPSDLSVTPTTDAFDKKSGTADNIDLPFTVANGTPTAVYNMDTATALTVTTHYTIVNGVVTILKAYLGTLANGTHELLFVTSIGNISVTITVTTTP